MKELKDFLPDGLDKENYIKEDREWPNLEKRLGQPRIISHVYVLKVLNWIQKKFQGDLEDFSYFEAGCGHGNDLRAFRKALNNNGCYLGVDISKAEILHGMGYYRDMEEAKRLFAQGNLKDLKNIKCWDEKRMDFFQPAEIKDHVFDLLYMEAIMHGFGYGEKTFEKKKSAAQQFLNEMYRICKIGGKFFGRANTFGGAMAKEEQLNLLREANDWRFIPEAQEFNEMLEQAGFRNIYKTLILSEKSGVDPARKDVWRFSFLAEK